jgi:nicotinamidase-related amidase
MKEHTSKAVNKDDRKLALVIVDVQKKFIVNARDSTLESARVHTPEMLKVIDMFRDAGRPVIWILYDSKTVLEGVTEETMELLDGFEIKDTDIVVKKYHMNSFNNTALSDIIHAHDCDAALIMGMFAQYCVMATYWGAFDKDVSPYLMQDCLISTDDDYCEHAFAMCKVYSMDELESNLRIHRVNRSAL